MTRPAWKGRWAYPLFLAGVCACLLVFFIRVHPLQVFDTDDWTYIAYSRNIFPDLREWNPARIFPEVLMPVCGAIGAYLIRPLTGDYLFSITIASALAVVGAIMAYLWLFGKVMERVFRLERWQTMAMTALFLLCHFWIFRSRPSGNTHLFYTHDLTCAFYYVISTLLNAGVVLTMELRPRLWQESGPMKRGVLLLAVYLAIFSNLFSSVVLAVYCGVRLLLGLVGQAKAGLKRALRELLRAENALLLGVVAMWLLSMCLEVMGGRARQVGHEASLDNLSVTLGRLYVLLAHANRYFLAFCAGVGGLALLLLARAGGRGEAEELLLRRGVLYVLCGLLTLLFLVLLCAVGALTYYIGRGDVALAFCFYFLLALCAAVGYILRKLPAVQVLVPLVLCLALYNTNTQAATFAEPNVLRLPPETISRYSADVLEQMVDASEQGRTELELLVPRYNDPDNWPQIVYFGNRVANTLLEHGMIAAAMEVRTVPDASVNAVYGFGQ